MSSKLYEISDLSMAAYFTMMGVPLVECGKYQDGKFYFRFDETNHDCSSLSFQYLNSEYAKFDANLRNLRAMMRNKKRH
jgi:hypothetical protein